MARSIPGQSIQGASFVCFPLPVMLLEAHSFASETISSAFQFFSIPTASTDWWTAAL